MKQRKPQAGYGLKGLDCQQHSYLLAVMDITEQKLARTALLEADRRKDEFLAMLAHELRNPLVPSKMRRSC